MVESMFSMPTASYVFSIKFRSGHICGVCMIVHIASRLVYIALGLEIPAKRQINGVWHAHNQTNVLCW
uniref:Uncharacterized protein n=1 Tax=Hordeum vulgare subsp. vulgare TaxID=112509 RepID=A0A8I6XH02_HORVV